MAFTDAKTSGTLFQYSPLPDTATNGQSAPHIRLIEVHNTRESADHPPRVSILRTSVEKAPLYWAISYTWGDETDQEQIDVQHCDTYFTEASDSLAAQNGTLQVRRNCADVLRQLAHFGISRYYWLDAVCIDQNVVQEMNVQVARMGETFREAEGVLACLGMHDSGSRFLADKLGEFDRHLAARGTSTFALTDPSLYKDWVANGQRKTYRTGNLGLGAKLQKAQKCVEACIGWLKDIDSEDFALFLKALFHLPEKPYFWRIWTLQEVWVARHLRFLCGFDELSISSLLFWWSDSQIRLLEIAALGVLGKVIRQKLRSSRRSGDHPIYGPPWYTFGSILGYDYERMLSDRQRVPTEGSASTIKKRNVSEPICIDLCKNRKCQDRRDTVYGTMTIIDWSKLEMQMPDGSWLTDEDENMAIMPDYTRSRFELAKLLLPRLQTPYAMRQVCVGMLRLSPEDEEIVRGLADRTAAVGSEIQFSPRADLTLDNKTWSRSNSPQLLAHTELSAILISSAYTLLPSTCPASGAPYTRLFSQGIQVGIASTGIFPSDWLTPHSGILIVLRRSGTLFSPIGNAAGCREVNEAAERITIDMWLGVEDLIMHLLTLPDCVWWELGDGGPEAGLVARINAPFWAKEGSSFGRLVGGDFHEPESTSSSGNRGLTE